ncbi:hypothetical protein K4T08_03075 [Staphylococcus epidermidis]|nr:MULTISPECIES: hypothetical protein [Staphylococcus]MBF2173618.1 hypothetical protein [Staphylococcus epidermidis]MBF2187548.1 hypothetical protein [Staphylococcus epidermidis]MCG1422100.1 hypothetical protein [Staphylococcus epidermidis]MCG1549440.1 hypothetical protein [Staphylococcus epidermidis]MCG1690362.1 hypothetical protein [Staphylococcus epidermidis]
MKLEQSNTNANILSAFSYFSVFFAPIILPLFVWIIADKPAATHGKKAFFNHIWIYVFIFLARAGFIFSNNVFNRPLLDNKELLFTIFIIFAIAMLIIAGIIFIINIIRGIKLLTNKY